MSLTLYGSSVPEPTPPAPVPDTRRRYLIIFATVLALILGGGSAAFLLLNTSPSFTSTAPNAYNPPNDGSAPIDAPAPSPSASTTASPSASPSHNPSPSRSASGRPSSPASGGTTTVFRAPNGVICPSVDFQPLISMPAPEAATPIDDHTDKSNYTDYTCHGSFGQSGKIVAQVDASIFTDAAGAAQSYADVKAYAPATSEKFTGIGTDAYGYVSNTSGFTLWVLDGNLTFKIILSAAGGQPTPGRLRDVAVKMAPNSLHNLVRT
jgi:hypothetical protein